MQDNPKIPLKLPIGVSDFAEFVKEKYFYADKTELIYQLVKDPKPFFLSRPRRFGKIAFSQSTIEYILRGNRDLFKGLWIDRSDYD